MERAIFSAEQRALRETVGRFLDREITPRYRQWERDGIIPHHEFKRASALGIVGMAIDERYGGPGAADFRFNAVVNEECHRRGLTRYAMMLQITTDVTLPYLVELTTEEQRQR
jgi:alkylation response protein AidB-like acyl-CoA dehydrogenase